MGEKSISERIFKTLQDISQYELNEIQLLIAIIKKNITDSIDKHMETIGNEFKNSCEYYGKNVADVVITRDEIINGYNEVFNKIASKFEEQYMNLALEIQEAQSNQKIAITNMKRVMDSKTKYINSDEYVSFKNKIKELEAKRDNAEIKAEYDSVVEYLESLRDPVELYDEKLEMFAQKYISYCAIEEQCIEKLKECNGRAKEAIDSVMKYEVGQLAVAPKKSIFSFFTKFLNKITGAKRFEKEYVLKKKNNLEQITVSTDALSEEISNDTISIVYSIDAYKQSINQAV